MSSSWSTGAGKAEIVGRLLTDGRSGAEGDLLPAERVRPTDGALTWIVDEAAAQKLRSAGMTAEIVPSILSADFARLGDQVREAAAAGATRFQVDVMDGVFVPNITMGGLAVEAVRRSTSAVIEAHLMIVAPERHLEAIAKAGADVIIVHQEACVHLHRIVQQIKDLGKQAGVALNPGHPAGDAGRDPALSGHGVDHDGQSRFRRAGVHREYAAQDPPPA